jgi:tRNA (guanine37-N1)-methyltransferase
MRLDFVTLFPDLVLGALRHSMLLRAERAGAVAFSAVNPRDFTTDRHQKVDDVPFGGGPGMLIMVEPVARALESIGASREDPATAIVVTDPSGTPFTQDVAQELSEKERLVFLCGHYEGFDHRVRSELATHALSIGDYVLTGGELPALVMADAVVRLLPGVLGNEQSLQVDSHSDGLLGAPNYTRPVEWRGHAVPEVLRSGDHVAIARWKRAEALRLTRRLRPDLLCRAKLDKRDADMLSSEVAPDPSEG